MRLRILPSIALVALTACTTSCTTTQTPIIQTTVKPWTATAPIFDHVVIVVLENENAAAVLPGSYLDSLATRGATLTSFHGVAHPSYPNYLALIAGHTFGVRGDLQADIDAPTIADRLEAKKLTWMQYAEDYPGKCFLKNSRGLYVRKHVPFLSFIAIQNNPARCAKVVNAKQFNRAKLPSYAFYTPNQENNGHNTSLAYATRWLRGFLEPMLADSAVMARTLIVVTFDEAEDNEPTNRIYTVLLGGMVRPGASDSTPLNHYNVLRTIEANFGLDPLGEEAQVTPITSIWKDPSTI
jgi:acid phosphatase